MGESVAFGGSGEQCWRAGIVGFRFYVGRGIAYSDQAVQKHITSKPFGVNVPIMYQNSAHTMEVVMEEGVTCGLHLCGESFPLDSTVTRTRHQSCTCGQQ